MAANDPVEEYRAKRDFDRTAEPAGDATDGGGRRFVASRVTRCTAPTRRDRRPWPVPDRPWPAAAHRADR